MQRFLCISVMILEWMNFQIPTIHANYQIIKRERDRLQLAHSSLAKVMGEKLHCVLASRVEAVFHLLQFSCHGCFGK